MAGSNEMKPATPGVKLTYDDYVLFPDDGKRHELIDGEHYVTPSPNRKHQAILWNLTGLMWTWVIDPELDTIKVYRRPGERYQRVAELTLEQNDLLSSPLLPGLEMALAKIFED
jgi:Uma2 family endonuclease